MGAATRRRLALRILALSSAIASASSCGEQRGKLAPRPADAEEAAGSGGTLSAGAADGGTGGTDDAGAGGTSSGGVASAMGGTFVMTAGAAGEGTRAAGGSEIGAGGVPSDRALCVYHADFGSVASAGAGGSGEEGGAGGSGAPAPPIITVAKATNRLIGDYLTDARGLALYVFGADLPGDCAAPPISTCTDDCLLSWPVFYAEPRVLAAGLDPAAFGSILRPDGRSQTTYFGWPLYYYANDVKAGDVTGHGSSVWTLAETILPNVVVRRVGADRFLADGAGHTLYAFADDRVGTATKPAESACVGACRETHPPFDAQYVGAVSTLEPRDFGLFERSDGGIQISYKGAPLYFSSLDQRPGDVNGGKESGWSIVLR
jgi:predicted lipoprotein with Yx(FWY)xxD motif